MLILLGLYVKNCFFRTKISMQHYVGSQLPSSSENSPWPNTLILLKKLYTATPDH